jgi:hypothetical protein
MHSLPLIAVRNFPISARHLFILPLAGLCLLSCKDNTVSSEDLLNDPAVKPAVIYTYPGINSTGPYDNFGTSITVRFNKLMDQASVQHAVSFDSQVGDLLPDTGRASSSTGEIYSITPVLSNPGVPFLWRVNKTYVLRIATTAVDVNGNDLTTPFIMPFTPEPYFRVKSVTPANLSINVSSNVFRLQLNAPVDTSFFSKISISPPVPGQWRYTVLSSFGVDSSQILFQSTRSLPVGSSYTLSITGQAHDKYGDPLVGGFGSSFSTTPFGIINTSPSNSSANISLAARFIGVSFTDSLDTATVRGAFSLSPPVPGYFIYSLDQSRFNYALEANLSPRTTYTITIDTSLRSKSGMRMPQPYVASFTTSDFVVTSAFPSNGDTTVYSRDQITLYFNGDIDTGSVRGAFSINPGLTGLFDFGRSTNSFSFSPIAEFVPGTTYTVTVSTDLRSVTGARLGAPYTFWFKAAPFKVTETYPPDGSTHVQRWTSIEVITSDIIDTSTIRGSFSISPQATGALFFSPAGAYFYLSADSLLQPLTVYTVTIATSLKSLSGANLKSPYTFSFATGE